MRMSSLFTFDKYHLGTSLLIHFFANAFISANLRTDKIAERLVNAALLAIDLSDGQRSSLRA